MTASPALLSVTGLCKSYATLVLSNVDFALHRGEVHALVGENGAGKTTLCRILAGLTKADAGTMTLRDQAYLPKDKSDAERHGVRMVMQELNLIGNLTVAESVLVDQIPHRLGWIDYQRLDEDARQVLAKVGLADLDPNRLVKTLGVGHQQLVAIAAGLSRQCDVLILDEPTAALTDPETDRLFEQISKLKAAGVGIIYISHRLEEIRRVADRLSVLRDGQWIATHAAGEICLDEIVRLMVGRELGAVTRRPHRPLGPLALRVQGLRRGGAVRDVSFEVHQGEILGIAGLMGSGRTETVRALFGADPRDGGEIYLHGARTPARITSPRDAVRNGMALLTENRKEHGLLLPLAVRANIALMGLRKLSRIGGWIRSDAEHLEAGRWERKLAIRCTSLEQRVMELSGGNQQKVVIAKWLLRDCRILIFDEPTRGIDVGAKFEVYRLLADLAENDKAIIIVSSELKELLALCDRIAVMSAGRLAATFARGEWTEERIMAAALSGYLRK